MPETKSLTLIAPKGESLGDVFAFVQDKFPDIQDVAADFTMKRGAAPFMGSGEAPIVEMHIVLPLEDQNALRFYEGMLEELAQRGAQVTILLDGEPYQPEH